jgi:2-keto-4-pentenoate hydratase/2-oxohepta-3-ene-1,7-dioic acid hydratase in catechol pathway
MKIGRFNDGRIGVIVGDTIIDVSAACGVDPAEWPPVGIVRTIGDFARLRPAIEKAAAGPGVPLSSVRLEAPITWPRNLLALPNNFADHSAEMEGRSYAGSTNNLGANLAGFFMKAASSIVGPNDVIRIPDMPEREFHYECELAIIIGKRAENVGAADALDHIFGYACLIDVTMRGKEERVMRKSITSFTPIGPWITTADEVGPTDGLELQLWVNGTLRQHAFAREMIVGIREAVELCSSIMPLEPGDIIAGGTMAGVGPLAGGDTVRIAIDNVGSMTLPVETVKPLRFSFAGAPALQ